MKRCGLKPWGTPDPQSQLPHENIMFSIFAKWNVMASSREELLILKAAATWKHLVFKLCHMKRYGLKRGGNSWSSKAAVPFCQFVIRPHVMWYDRILFSQMENLELYSPKVRMGEGQGRGRANARTNGLTNGINRSWIAREPESKFYTGIGQFYWYWCWYWYCVCIYIYTRFQIVESSSCYGWTFVPWFGMVDCARIDKGLQNNFGCSKKVPKLAKRRPKVNKICLSQPPFWLVKIRWPGWLPPFPVLRTAKRKH